MFKWLTGKKDKETTDGELYTEVRRFYTPPFYFKNSITFDFKQELSEDIKKALYGFTTIELRGISGMIYTKIVIGDLTK